MELRLSGSSQNDLRPERRKRNELDSMHWEPERVVMLLA
jgi:hypothetical protein